LATRLESATGVRIGKALTLSKTSNYLNTIRLKTYMAKKDYGSLSISHTQQKFAKSLQRVF
jgi:hypothetical protein